MISEQDEVEGVVGFTHEDYLKITGQDVKLPWSDKPLVERNGQDDEFIPTDDERAALKEWCR